ncbi:MAG: tetratricopeptide repeat protein [Bacteroidales bacterium]|nr:tetratricopeptide repeat protein [Bacteroidales bacterium]
MIWLKKIPFFLLGVTFTILQAQIPASVQKEVKANDDLAEKYLSEGNLAGAAQYFNQSAYILRNHHLNEQAVKYYERIIEINKQLNNQKGLLLTYNNLGMILLDIEKYEQALVHLEKSLELSRKIDTKESVISALTNIAVALQGLSKFNESNHRLETAVEMAKDLNDLKLLRRCYGILYENYDKMGQSDKSYQYFELYSTLDKEIKKREMQQVKQEAATEVNKAQFEKQLTEDELNIKKKELKITTDSLIKVEELTREQQLEIEVKEQELQIKDAELKLQRIRTRLLLYGSVILLVFLLIVSFLLFKTAHCQ